MDRGTRVFWVLIVLLMGSSVYFGLHAEQRRRAVQHGSGERLEMGQVVRLERVIDGDTVLVNSREGGDPVAVRLVGIKSFAATLDKDPAARFGRAAEKALRDLLTDGEIVVDLHAKVRDRYGRTLAKLRVGERDAGLELVERGLALVYDVYPFEGMQEYLAHQRAARAARRGLWSDPAVAQRASRLLRRWEEQAE